LRKALPANARPVAHWRVEDAAFLAAHVPEKGVWSVVRLDNGKTEIRFDGKVHATAGTPISSLDLEGVVAGSTVVLFHNEARLAGSVLSFDTGKQEPKSLRFIVTGVAPGAWDIWRDGWLIEDSVPVRAGEAVLSFSGRPGSYFLRRL
jgi:hypothetical protein